MPNSKLTLTSIILDLINIAGPSAVFTQDSKKLEMESKSTFGRGTEKHTALMTSVADYDILRGKNPAADPAGADAAIDISDSCDAVGSVCVIYPFELGEINRQRNLIVLEER